MTDEGGAGAAAVRLLLPGYDVVDRVGAGGWCVLWRARHRLLGHDVVLKQLRPEFAGDAQARARLRQEAAALAALSHPHLLRGLDYAESADASVAVVEYLAGGDVWQRFCTSGLHAVDACGVALAALAGLHHLHGYGLVHGDVSPTNLALDDGGIVKLTDLGVATPVDSLASEQFDAPRGTPTYMAPEQCVGGQLSPATDVYGLGVLLYQLLSGDLPFPTSDLGADLAPMEILRQRVRTDPRPLDEAAPGLPTPVVAVVMMALERRPDRRYASAEDCAVALAAAARAAWGAGWLSGVSSAVFLSGRVRSACG